MDNSNYRAYGGADSTSGPLGCQETFSKVFLENRVGVRLFRFGGWFPVAGRNDDFVRYEEERSTRRTIYSKSHESRANRSVVLRVISWIVLIPRVKKHEPNQDTPSLQGSLANYTLSDILAAP